MPLCTSAPPHSTRSLVPAASWAQAESRAASEAAQAASTVKLLPPRSSRLAMRPAITLVSTPGKESSVRAGRYAVELGGHLSQQLGHHGSQAVAAGQVVAALGPEHDRGPGPVELAVRVAGVVQGPGGHLQAQQLERFDGGQRGRGDPVGQRVEPDLGQEASPLRRRLAPGPDGGRLGVEVEVGVPTGDGHLGDGVHAADDVGPELVRRRRTGEHRGHAHDGHLERCRGRMGTTGGGDHLGRRRLDHLRAGLAHVVVEIGDGGDLPAQGGHLADHEHAVAALGGLVHRHQAVGAVDQALAGDAQTTQVERLELGPHVLHRHLLAFEPSLGLGEVAHVVGLHAAGGVTRGGLQQHRLGAAQGDVLEGRGDGPAGSRLRR